MLSVLGTMDLLYIECKTGRFKGKKIFNMLERARSLHALASIMFIDGNISEVSLKDQIKSISYPGLERRPEVLFISTKGIQDSGVYQWNESFFVEAKRGLTDIEAKIRTVLRFIECKRAELARQVSASVEDYTGAGYEIRLVEAMQPPIS